MMIKKCFGLISWLPDKEEHRQQRITRLNSTFEQLIKLFGNDIEFLIIAQNWNDYEIPKFVEHATIKKFDKLGILGARKMLRKCFVESDYDYLIMCDDDIVLEEKIEDAARIYLSELDKHPDGFSFLKYGWSLTFCAVSRWIYEREDMVDVDPEKSEGYEDVIFPNLLHYKYKNHEFKTEHLLKFVQHENKFHKNHKSTWMNQNIKYAELTQKTKMYVDSFKKGNFNFKEIKKRIDQVFKPAWTSTNKPFVGQPDAYLYF